MAFLKESNQIKKLFSSLNKNDEFEVMFNNYKQDNKLSFNKFMNMLKYLKWKSDTEDYKINFEESLDISYNSFVLSSWNASSFHLIIFIYFFYSSLVSSPFKLLFNKNVYYV